MLSFISSLAKELILDKLFESLAKLIETTKKNILGTILVAIIAIAAFGGTQMWHTISKVAEHFPTSQVESERFNKQIIAQKEIADLLEFNRQQLNGDRIGIRQFHNGRTDLTGLPFTSVSTTYVKTKENVSFDPSGYNPVPLSTMNDVLLKMWDNPRKPECAFFVTSELKGAYRQYLQDKGVYKYYSCPIVNLQGWPIGIVSVSYLDEKTSHPSDAVIFKTLSATSDKVSGYLLAVAEPNKSSWFTTK